MAHSHAVPHAFDETDPHGAGHKGQHSSHVIVGPFQLRLVLAILLFFTAATVGFAELEVWVEGLIGMTLPWWINVAGAMSIAVVKCLLVMAIFMQLRYDNPINSVVMALTFAALGCFLVFTGLDLFNRGQVDDWKAPQAVHGGTGMSVLGPKNQPSAEKPVVIAARERFIKMLDDRHGRGAGAAKFAEIRASLVHEHHLGPHDDGLPSANHARPRTGLSGALSTELPPVLTDHGGHAPAAAPKTGH